jgi:cation diffusion facilitator CzcD-associated flavoprotein CzcO
MNLARNIRATTDTEHFDVLIVGAGISGIDAACHLSRDMPGKTYAVLEKAGGIGGTWLTHSFPGIRTDSDFYTFGYAWKPWTGKMLATADKILTYLDEAVRDHGLGGHIRLGHAVRSASWSRVDKRWTLAVEDVATGSFRAMTCSFLWMCQGYYDHEAGYRPDFPGEARFGGPIIHPQHWPGDFDATGRRIAVIGSGATAATLVPALAETAAHVTIVQRSPTYFLPRPMEHELAAQLRPLNLPPEWFHEIMRRRVLQDQSDFYRRCVEEPDIVRKELLAGARAFLGNSAAIDPHFTPSYPVWRQRVAVVPDGDMFKAIRAGKAGVVTGRIETFTETGLRMEDGTEIEADAIVTATGLNLQVMGGIPFTIDGQPHDFARSVMHRGMMFSDVPNLAWIFGYFRASWTMRADLVCAYVIRLLSHMAETGADIVEPRLGQAEADMPHLPFISPDNFNPGYLMRVIDKLPKQGDRGPWVFTHDYAVEKDTIPNADLDDGTLVYS